jgi:hypothetical protein
VFGTLQEKQHSVVDNEMRVPCLLHEMDNWPNAGQYKAGIHARPINANNATTAQQAHPLLTWRFTVSDVCWMSRMLPGKLRIVTRRAGI